MKKIFVIALVLCMLSPCTMAETVVRKKIEIQFSEVKREGLYTGEINEDGEPNGFGVFEAVNQENAKYIIVGDWVNGSQTGEAWRALDTGYQYIGTFENGDFIKGKYIESNRIEEYDRALDTRFGYTPDTLMDMDFSQLDNESILRLIHNICGSDPINNNSSYIWIVENTTFCGLPITAIWASVNDKGDIATINYIMAQQKAAGKSILSENAVSSDLDLIDKLINRLNARLGKTGIIILDNITMSGDKLTDTLKGQIYLNCVKNNGVVFSYSWNYDRGIIYSANWNESTILFTIHIK